MALSSPEQPVTEVINSPVRNIVGSAILSLVVLFGAAGTVIADSLFGKAFYLLVTVAGGTAVVRAARAAVVVRQDGLVIRDTVRTRRVPWSDVHDIWSAAEDPAFRAVSVVTTTGHIRCSALGAFRRESPYSPRLRRLYERLHRHLGAARADGRCPQAYGGVR